MHKFMRAIGFSDINQKALDLMLEEIIKTTHKVRVTGGSDGNKYAEIRQEIAPNMGIMLRGTFEEGNKFCFEYYFPYLFGENITTTELVEIERHAEKESYAGLCDDRRVGMTLIFYLQNMVEYLTEIQAPYENKTLVGTVITGLSTEGKILLPMDSRMKEQKSRVTYDRNSEMMAAGPEDEEKDFMEQTMEDFHLYERLSKRIEEEDILTIVNSTLMPYGVESDQYSILGEILSYKKVQNPFTRENIYQMQLQCNGLVMDLCINEKDLVGVPDTGRRFKGNLWMQGRLCFENS